MKPFDISNGFFVGSLFGITTKVELILRIFDAYKAFKIGGVVKFHI